MGCFIPNLLSRQAVTNKHTSLQIYNISLISEHIILEQIIYAALDCHAYGMAYACISLLSKEFPGSLRVMRYKAALMEAEEKYVLFLK